jgi:hypothetical protein
MLEILISFHFSGKNETLPSLHHSLKIKTALANICYNVGKLICMLDYRLVDSTGSLSFHSPTGRE